MKIPAGNNLMHDSSNFGKYLTSKVESNAPFDDVYSRPIDVVYRVSPEALKQRKSFLEQQTAEEEESEFPAIDLERIEKENNELSATANLETAFIDSKALPILEELWSVKSVEDQITETSLNAHSLARRKLLRKLLLETASSITSICVGHCVGVTKTFRPANEFYAQRIPSLHRLIHKTPFRKFIKIAYSDKPASEKIKDALKLSLCFGIPYYGSLAAIEYYVHSKIMRSRVAKEVEEQTKRIKEDALKHLMKPVDAED